MVLQRLEDKNGARLSVVGLRPYGRDLSAIRRQLARKQKCPKEEICRWTG
jgi:hypothetical protein